MKSTSKIPKKYTATSKLFLDIRKTACFTVRQTSRNKLEGAEVKMGVPITFQCFV
jgi:hypothetical protein